MMCLKNVCSSSRQEVTSQLSCTPVLSADNVADVHLMKWNIIRKCQVAVGKKVESKADLLELASLSKYNTIRNSPLVHFVGVAFGSAAVSLTLGNCLTGIKTFWPSFMFLLMTTSMNFSSSFPSSLWILSISGSKKKGKNNHHSRGETLISTSCYQQKRNFWH